MISFDKVGDKLLSWHKFWQQKFQTNILKRKEGQREKIQRNVILALKGSMRVSLAI